MQNDKIGIKTVGTGLLTCPHRKRGFTLLELLAVLVILAALSTIAIPIFTNMGGTARELAHNSNVAMLQKQAQLYLVMESEVPTNEEDILQKMVNKGYIKEKPENPIKSGTGSGAYAAKYQTATGRVTVTPAMVEVTNTAGGGSGGSGAETPAEVVYNGTHNVPKIVGGMTAVNWNGSAWTSVANPDTDTSWYAYTGDVEDGNYATKEKWANVELLDGSMFVWIPRYTYKITGIGASGKIAIKYSEGTVDNTTDSYLTHPAFNFGGTQLTGIWVAKFEASSNNVENSIAGDNVTTKKVKILPNVDSWRYINIGNAFQVCRNMQTDTATYGWTDTSKLDIHMMKNSEWGAVAYLTEAVRDGDEIYINNYYDYGGTINYPVDSGDEGTSIWDEPGVSAKTGYAGGTKDATRSNAVGTSTYTYNTPEGQKASTTGNIYGIYDMSGGNWERVSSYIANGNENLATYGAQLVAGGSKYKEVLNEGTGTFDIGATDDEKSQNNWSITSLQTLGMALNEVMTAGYGTSDFRGYGDYQYFPLSSSPFFVRGGSFANVSSAGVFARGSANGYPYSNNGFRPSVVALQ